MSKFRHTIPILLLLVSGPAATAGEGDSACNDTVTVGELMVPVPLHWCGHQIDSGLLATPEMLVKLPDNLTLGDFRIFMRPEARDAFVRMAQAALKEDIRLIVKSGYRSHSFQQQIIRKRLEQGNSLEGILMRVAPPGYSEHETGTAVDLHSSDGLFAKSAAYTWLKKNADRFGFVESYPKNGFLFWEPWHFCYKPELTSD